MTTDTSCDGPPFGAALSRLDALSAAFADLAHHGGQEVLPTMNLVRPVARTTRQLVEDDADRTILAHTTQGTENLLPLWTVTAVTGTPQVRLVLRWHDPDAGPQEAALLGDDRLHTGPVVGSIFPIVAKAETVVGLDIAVTGGVVRFTGALLLIGGQA